VSAEHSTIAAFFRGDLRELGPRTGAGRSHGRRAWARLARRQDAGAGGARLVHCGWGEEGRPLWGLTHLQERDSRARAQLGRTWPSEQQHLRGGLSMSCFKEHQDCYNDSERMYSDSDSVERYPRWHTCQRIQMTGQLPHLPRGSLPRSLLRPETCQFSLQQELFASDRLGWSPQC